MGEALNEGNRAKAWVSTVGMAHYFTFDTTLLMCEHEGGKVGLWVIWKS
jgi:hypothetical protein